MGGCISKKSVLNSDNIIKASNDIRVHTSNLNHNEIRESNNEIKFQDMEEYEDKYSGEGIKRIKAYKCNLLINDLSNLRADFWNSRKDHKRHWQIIQRACELDFATAELILSNAAFACLDGNIKCLVDTETGVVFNIPNFCINDPFYKKEFPNPEEVPEKIINITLIYVFKNGIKSYHKISNKKKGADLKALFYKQEKITQEEYKVRLLYKGQEIKDEDFLSIYNFEKHPQVQVSCTQIEEEIVADQLPDI